MLWPRLEEPDDRALVLEEVERTTKDRRAAGVLHHWLAVRLLADLVTKFAPGDWDRPRIEATRGPGEGRPGDPGPVGES